MWNRSTFYSRTTFMVPLCECPFPPQLMFKRWYELSRQLWARGIFPPLDDIRLPTGHTDFYECPVPTSAH